MATQSSRPRRLAAVCAAGMLAVGPALVAGPAFADTPTVAFSGGSVVGMLVCRSQPSAGQVTIAPESRVLFVNRLGQPATLRVGAQVVAKVGANQAVPVVFHYGPVPVSMAIPCSVGVVEQFESVTVAVSRPASGSSAAAGSGRSGIGHSTADRGGAAAGTPTADPAMTPPDVSGSADPLGLAPATTGPDTAVAVEPLVPASGTPRLAASGLLALVAAVCAIGVTVAAIRAIIAQRTSRISLA
jgi:hypothetical protein